ncbi:hypothetical protein KS4_22810 [Poriferisphaera corsica]|uniref:LarC family nickel insertion protein n=1 Tax=Poriferisphaera corsica TaxID=2528020 RepID=A0A517YVI0_9BACT|nr:LarC family nickel insertion protein [Poriferisphaera corsica]QDU34216.1 hypothetical protein KS4_22810 [Poriferisphaera corsica]
MSRHLHIDAFSGIAGDMFLGALIDLGVDAGEIEQSLRQLPVEKEWELSVKRVSRHGIGAIDLKVLTGENKHSHHHDEQGHHHHHHTNYHDIMHMIDHLDTTERGKDKARRVVTLLGESEARVHETTLDKIHFHEVGAVDSIVDMLGSVVALELLGVDSLSCGVLPMSRGFVKCDHGVMPVPAPATAYLLEGLATIGVDRKGELVTPTGAALVKGLCEEFGAQPGMMIDGVGYGAGDREDPEIPNLLRLFVGERVGAKRLMPTIESA